VPEKLFLTSNKQREIMKRFWIVILIITLFLSACSTKKAAPTAVLTARPEPKTLTVFAAASLTDAFGEIGKAFEAANPGVTVQFNFAGSQTLRTQIEQGAQADVFASANTKEMNTLVSEMFVITNTTQIFLTNKLVVILPANNPAGLAALSDLAKPGLKIDMAAKEVPVGNYALQVLDKLDSALGNGFKDKVLANVVSYENDVKQVVAKIQLGEADAGIVYTSDAVAAPDLKKIDIPAEDNVIAQYPLAALAQSKNPVLAQVFVAYVLSDNGQSVLKKWGFLPAK
jgi:molybdate transport system substrate-binding protein